MSSRGPPPQESEVAPLIVVTSLLPPLALTLPRPETVIWQAPSGSRPDAPPWPCGRPAEVGADAAVADASSDRPGISTEQPASSGPTRTATATAVRTTGPGRA